MITTTGVSTRITLNNILYLTDFSEPSEAALPFATAIARGYGAIVHALHVLMPSPVVYMTPELVADGIAGQEEAASLEMQRVESALAGLPHETIVERGSAVWPTLERAIKEHMIDLVVLGTHGRTGTQKFLLGSVAEEIFRRSPVPVLTIGPWAHSGAHNDARFHRVLFATDFTAESLSALPYAVSIAQENQARLFLLNVIRSLGQDQEEMRGRRSAANTLYELNEMVPKDAELWCRPEAIVEHGEPAEGILEAAKQRGADLIVLGVRDAAGHLGAATHLERTTAHKVVAHAPCPVLTVRL
jgi:nucleotide-binding universal stress UspA family protein